MNQFKIKKKEIFLEGIVIDTIIMIGEVPVLHVNIDVRTIIKRGRIEVIIDPGLGQGHGSLQQNMTEVTLRRRRMIARQQGHPCRREKDRMTVES